MQEMQDLPLRAMKRIANQLILQHGESLPSNFIMVNRDELDEMVHAFRSRVPNVEIRVDLAHMDDPLVLRRLAEHKVSFGVSSEYHINLLRSIDVPFEDLHAWCPAYPGKMIESLKTGKVSSISVDSLAEFERLSESGVLTSEREVCVKISGSLLDISYASREEAVAIFLKAHELGLTKFAISIDIGFHRNSDIQSFPGCFEVLRALKDRNPDIRISRVDVCDRFPSPYSEARFWRKSETRMSYFQDEISRFNLRLADAEIPPVKISAECSRLLVGSSPVITNVTAARLNPATNTMSLFCEETMYGSLNGLMFAERAKWLSDVIVLGQNEIHDKGLEKSELVPTTLWLGSCDGVDSGRGPVPTYHGDPLYLFPKGTRAGDRLLIPNRGFDSISKAAAFNMIDPAAVVMTWQDSSGIHADVSPLSNRTKFIVDEVRGFSSTAEAQKIRELVEARSHSATSKLRHSERSASFSEQLSLRDQPFIGMEIESIVAAVTLLCNHLRLPMSSLKIAIKACDDPLHLTVLKALGTDVDAASAGEISLALAIGWSPKQIIMSHPHATKDTLKFMADTAPGAQTVDSLEELIRRKAAGINMSSSMNFLRVAIKATDVQTDLNMKFGCNPKDALRIMVEAKRLGFGDLQLAGHPGTQITTADNHRRMCEQYLDIARVAKKCGIVVTHFNFGGGFPDRVAAEKAGTTQDKVLREIGTKFDLFRNRARAELGIEPVMWIEPGRILCEQGVLYQPIKRVTHVSPGNGYDALHVRIAEEIRGSLSGMLHDERQWQPRPVRADAEERLTRLSKRYAEARVFGISGSTDDEIKAPRDNMFKLPDNIRSGDWLAFDSGGAYTASTSAFSAGKDRADLLLSFSNPPLIIQSPLRNESALYPIATKKWWEERKALDRMLE